MKIYYVYHSCFAIESENYKLIFDYYKTPDKNIGDFSLNDFLKGDKPIYVFSTHSHGDHFNKNIFDWSGNITYILSDDILDKRDEKKIHFVKNGDRLNIDNISIDVFGSTDLGVSFLIGVDGRRFFYSGDLNWWYWSDDTQEEYEYMKNFYFSIIEDIKSYVKEQNIEEIEYLFIPVDPRLEQNYYLGADYFVQNIRVKNIICMHFWNDFTVIERLKEVLKDRKINVIDFNKNLTEIV